MQGVYKNIEEYNTGTKPKILIVFDDMITDMISNKNLLLPNYLLEAENKTFHLFLLHNHILKNEKMLD